MAALNNSKHSSQQDLISLGCLVRSPDAASLESVLHAATAFVEPMESFCLQHDRQRLSRKGVVKGHTHRHHRQSAATAAAIECTKSESQEQLERLERSAEARLCDFACTKLENDSTRTSSVMRKAEASRQLRQQGLLTVVAG
ncbi:hypothetical protein cyc_08354 [Cyclospora cayetanensis]|uniref:Uncharacterized protein n=1 Tax=Cyclospora cayetanensis TaxID=88456 RepID=A0A1D3D2D9_9EIME|nr:hypothetical protein cyc_08354 [Cyclospora cayetanensis]